MARWKLTEPHYLNCPSSRWEQTAVDARTGKPTRKMFKVPLHLDPRVADDWNVKFPNNEMDGEIHVCWEGKGLPNDIIFEGDPTPGMVPLDEEAREITARFSWTPTQGIDEESQRAGFFARLGDDLINQLTDLKAAAATQQNTFGVDKVLEAMAVMMKQNQELIALLAGKAAPVDELERQAKALGETKPEEFEDDLVEVEPTEAELAEAARIAAEKEAASHAKARAHVSGRRL